MVNGLIRTCNAKTMASEPFKNSKKRIASCSSEGLAHPRRSCYPVLYLLVRESQGKPLNVARTDAMNEMNDSFDSTASQ